MNHELLGAVLFVVLALLALPLPRVKRIVLGLLHLGLHLTVLLGIAVAALFFYRPELIPEELSRGLEPFSDWLAAQLGGSLLKDNKAIVFLPLAAVLVCGSWPLLTLVDLARRFVKHTILWERILREAARQNTPSGPPENSAASGATSAAPIRRLLRDFRNK